MITLLLCDIGDRIHHRPAIIRNRRIVPFMYTVGQRIYGGRITDRFYDFEDGRYPAYKLDSGVVVLQKDIVQAEGWAA